MSKEDRITVVFTALRAYADSTNYGHFLSDDECRHIATVLVNAEIKAESGKEI